MDKLERALEKARRQRSETLANAGLPPFGGSSPPVMPRGLNEVAVGKPLTSPVLMVDEDCLERHRIIAHKTRNSEADVFRILRAQVLQIMNKGGHRTLAITSPHYGDGKTTVALNLALSIALDVKQTVLVVDLDLRKPALHECLGITPTSGLGDYLARGTPLPSCLTRLSFDRISVLPGGNPLDNSSELLGSPKMAALAHEMKNRYADRIIIYDMPPVLAQDDALAFLPQVDATLVVIREGATRANDLKMCLTRLGNASANVIGTVLNNVV